VGENLVYGLLIFAIFRAITGRKNANLSGLAFAAIVGALVAASLIGYARQKASSDRVVAHISQDLSSITNASVDAQGKPKKIDTVLDTTNTEPGEVGEVERFTEVYLNKGVALRDDYVGRLQALGWSNIMSPDRIAQDAGLVQSFAMLESATALLQTFNKKCHALQDDAPLEIDTLAVPDSTKAEMRKGFDKGVRHSMLNNLIDLQERTLAEYRAIFRLLRDTQGQWAVNKGMIDFQREQDLKAFQAHAAQIDKNLDLGEALEKAQVANAQSTIKGASQ
jgi:hypothetical protein